MSGGIRKGGGGGGGGGHHVFTLYRLTFQNARLCHQGPTLHHRSTTCIRERFFCWGESIWRHKKKEKAEMWSYWWYSAVWREPHRTALFLSESHSSSIGWGDSVYLGHNRDNDLIIGIRIDFNLVNTCKKKTVWLSSSTKLLKFNYLQSKH